MTLKRHHVAARTVVAGAALNQKSPCLPRQYGATEPEVVRQQAFVGH